MAVGAQRLFSADCTVAVTGIAGPTGGTPDKPVGTVWLAVAVDTKLRALKRLFPGDRDEVRRRSAQAPLDLLRRALATARFRPSPRRTARGLPTPRRSRHTPSPRPPSSI